MPVCEVTGVQVWAPGPRRLGWRKMLPSLAGPIQLSVYLIAEGDGHTRDKGWRHSVWKALRRLCASWQWLCLSLSPSVPDLPIVWCLLPDSSCLGPYDTRPRAFFHSPVWIQGKGQISLHCLKFAEYLPHHLPPHSHEQRGLKEDPAERGTLCSVQLQTGGGKGPSTN